MHAPPPSPPFSAPPPPYAGQPGRPGMVHVHVNAALQIFLAALHLCCGGAALIHTGRLGTTESVATSAEQAGYVLALVLSWVWAIGGLIWAPLNAYGLWSLRPWARASTIAYWAMSILTICCAPFG